MTESIAKSERTQSRAVVYVGALILMLSTIGIAPLNRTQEARVLETAREMLNRGGDDPGGLRGWMIPHVNGNVRLQKPPLAYWLAAGSFKVFGVDVWSGRVPMALCGWLVVCVTYSIARRSFDDPTAFASTGLLVGSFLFFHLARLAETDVLLTLSLTIAIGAMLRAARDDKTDLRWHAISGVAIGFAGIAKGLPAAFAILFLLSLTLAHRNWRLPLRWVISGAPLIALAIALPWWLFAKSLPESQIINHELDVVLEGKDHFGWFWDYFSFAGKAALPWTPLLVIAIVESFRRARNDRRITDLLVWIGSIFIPLCFIWNKQDHYLLPIMPPLAILTARWMVRVIPKYAPPIAIACAVGMTIGAGIVAPRWEADSGRDVADRLRALNGSSYCFYGPNLSLPLVFEMRTIIPSIPTPEALEPFARHHGRGLIVIAQTKPDFKPPAMPESFVKVDTFKKKEQTIEFYRAK